MGSVTAGRCNRRGGHKLRRIITRCTTSMFNIEFISGPHSHTGDDGIVFEVMHGRITLGAFSEKFVSSLAYWSADDYRRHWRQAAQRLLEGCPSTAFFTDVYDPEHDTPESVWLWVWWPMWRFGDVVRVQSQLLILGDLDGPMDPLNPYGHINDWNNKTAEGEPVSEWVIRIEDLAGFADRAAEGGAA